MSNRVLDMAKALQYYGLRGEQAIRESIDLLIRFGMTAEATAEVLNKASSAFDQDLNAPLPRHQTSLVRLNYHANGGNHDPDS